MILLLRGGAALAGERALDLLGAAAEGDVAGLQAALERDGRVGAWGACELEEYADQSCVPLHVFGVSTS